MYMCMEISSSGSRIGIKNMQCQGVNFIHARLQQVLFVFGQGLDAPWSLIPLYPQGSKHTVYDWHDWSQLWISSCH